MTGQFLFFSFFLLDRSQTNANDSPLNDVIYDMNPIWKKKLSWNHRNHKYFDLYIVLFNLLSEPEQWPMPKMYSVSYYSFLQKNKKNFI